MKNKFLWIVAAFLAAIILIFLYYIFTHDLVIMSWIRDTNSVDAHQYLYNSTNAGYSVASSGYSQQQANPALAAIIPAAASLIGSIFGGVSQSKANEANLAFQREQMANNNQQAELQRLWSEKMQRQQNAWQSQQWQKAFDMENAYNSPVQQMRRLAAAGINPYVAASDVAEVSSKSTLAPPQQGIAPSGAVASSSGNPNIQPVYQGGFSGLAEIANAFKALGEAKKAGVETTMLEKNLDIWLGQQREQLHLMQLDSEFNEIRNQIQSKYGDSTAARQLEYVAGQVFLNLAKENESKASTQNIMQACQESISRMKLNDSQVRKLDAELPYVVPILKGQLSVLRSQEASNYAAASASYASAQKSVAEATQVNELTGVIKELTHNKAEMTKAEANNLYVGMVDKLLDLGVKYQTLPYQIQNAYNQAKHGNMQNIVDQYNYINGFMEHNSQTIPLIGSMVKFGGY